MYKIVFIPNSNKLASTMHMEYFEILKYYVFKQDQSSITLYDISSTGIERSCSIATDTSRMHSLRHTHLLEDSSHRSQPGGSGQYTCINLLLLKMCVGPNIVPWGTPHKNGKKLICWLQVDSQAKRLLNTSVGSGAADTSTENEEESAYNYLFIKTMKIWVEK